MPTSKKLRMGSHRHPRDEFLLNVPEAFATTGPINRAVRRDQAVLRRHQRGNVVSNFERDHFELKVTNRFSRANQ